MATDTVPVRIRREVLQEAKLNALLAGKPLQDWLTESVEQRIKLEARSSVRVEISFRGQPLDEVVGDVMDDYRQFISVASSAVDLIDAVKERDESLLHVVNGDADFIRELIERDPWKVKTNIALLESALRALTGNQDSTDAEGANIQS
jgi:hypothetical protein